MQKNFQDRQKMDSSEGDWILCSAISQSCSRRFVDDPVKIKGQVVSNIFINNYPKHSSPDIFAASCGLKYAGTVMLFKLLTPFWSLFRRSCCLRKSNRGHISEANKTKSGVIAFDINKQLPPNSVCHIISQVQDFRARV